MKTFALIKNNVIDQISCCLDTIPIPIFDGVETKDITGMNPLPEIGWTFDGINFSSINNIPIATQIRTAKDSKKTSVAAFRFRVETGNILFDGIIVNTDRESQSIASSLFTSFTNNIISEVDWKTGDGTWISVTKESFTPIAQAIVDHVQKSFTQEKIHDTNIEGLITLASVNSYDYTIGWPKTVTTILP